MRSTVFRITVLKMHLTGLKFVPGNGRGAVCCSDCTRCGCAGCRLGAG